MVTPDEWQEDFWKRNAELVEEERRKRETPAKVNPVRQVFFNVWIDRNIRHINKKGPLVKRLQDEHHRHKGLKIRIEVANIGFVTMLRLQPGFIERLSPDAEWDLLVRLLTAGVGYRIQRGRIDIVQQDGSHIEEPYGCLDAWRRGEAVIISKKYEGLSEFDMMSEPGWLSDLLLLDELLRSGLFRRVVKK